MKGEQVENALQQKFVSEGARLVFWHDTDSHPRLCRVGNQPRRALGERQPGSMALEVYENRSQT